MSTDEKKRNVEAGGDLSESDVVTGDENTVQRAGVVVNVGSQREAPAQRARGRLMPEVEAELRGNILELTRAIIRLEGVVDKNNALSSEQIGAIREQVRAMHEQAATMEKQMTSLMGLGIVSPTRPVPRWMTYLVVTCMTIIAFGVTTGLFYMIGGGR